jgi:hypothetical protein
VGNVLAARGLVVKYFEAAKLCIAVAAVLAAAQHELSPQLGESLFFVSKVPFSPIFFAQISFGKHHFSPFFANNKAPFFAAFRSAKKVPFFAIFRQQQSAIFAAFRSAKKSAVFREKNREKQARPNSQPKTGPFYAAFCTAKSTIFRHFLPREKSAIFHRISLREKKCHFSRKKSRKTGSTQSSAGGNNYPENGLVKPPRRDAQALSPAGSAGSEFREGFFRRRFKIVLEGLNRFERGLGANTIEIPGTEILGRIFNPWQDFY